MLLIIISGFFILTNPIIKLIEACKILEIAKELLGEEIELELSRFHLTENFSHVGNWHRDEKINHANDSLQINLFLYDEIGLQVIDNSHTSEIKEVDLIKKTPHISLENSAWVTTKAGDILLFDPAVLHRGISLYPRANIHFRFRKKKTYEKKVKLNYKNLDISKDWLNFLENSPKATDKNLLIPCTPYGCLIMLKSLNVDLVGKNAVVIGRSNIVGKPMAQLLIKESCTVTIAHSKTKDLEKVCKNADIIVAAVGKPEMVRGDWINKGAIVIDVGINRIETQINGKTQTRLVGDVNYAEAEKKALAITPVPGGVGPMTIACLLRNTTIAFKNSKFD